MTANYLRIATEEAFAPPEMLELYRKLIEEKRVDEPGFNAQFGFYLNSDSPRARHIIASLQDLGAGRLAHMDRAGIDRQVLSLTSPGVQVMDRATAVSFATHANDYVAEAVRARPDRFSAIAAVAPQDPQAAAREIERCVSKLGLKGLVINSHTFGEYLDDEKFWPIFEAAEAMNAPLYLHPNNPPKRMIGPFLERGLDGAIYGFSVETALHVLRIIVAGVFDRFPKLTLVIGHMGEALPFWLFRLDYMHQATVASGRYASVRPLRRKPSEYIRQNVYVTSSGMAWEPALSFTQSVLGVDRVMYAMDYPYQYDPSEVASMDALDLSPDDKRRFFQSNAESVFGLASSV